LIQTHIPRRVEAVSMMSRAAARSIFWVFMV
jgi:hypothetical protein